MPRQDAPDAVGCRVVQHPERLVGDLLGPVLHHSPLTQIVSTSSRSNSNENGATGSWLSKPITNCWASAGSLIRLAKSTSSHSSVAPSTSTNTSLPKKR